MMKKFMKKLWDKKDSKKGFTLVELIVVLVILAILAAIMVPALLGWIDKAKEKQYVLEARNIYMAVQTTASQKYAAGATSFTLTDEDVEDIAAMADVTIASGDIDFTTVNSGTGATADAHDKFTIETMKVKFTSNDGKDVYATLDGKNNNWIVNTTAPDDWS